MNDDEKLCGCMKCTHERSHAMWARGEDAFQGPGVPGFRYACEICGNKRCPHHSDHTLVCTNSNEPGQPGSQFT